MNVVVKLSAWAAIILIPTLIAGIYGMNFRHMPELDWRFGYPFAIGLMGVVVRVVPLVPQTRLALKGEGRAPSAPGLVSFSSAAPAHAFQERRALAIRTDTMMLARPLNTDRSGTPYASARPGQYRVACWNRPA